MGGGNGPAGWREINGIEWPGKLAIQMSSGPCAGPDGVCSSRRSELRPIAGPGGNSSARVAQMKTFRAIDPPDFLPPAWPTNLTPNLGA